MAVHLQDDAVYCKYTRQAKCTHKPLLATHRNVTRDLKFN